MALICCALSSRTAKSAKQQPEERVIAETSEDLRLMLSGMWPVKYGLLTCESVTFEFLNHEYQWLSQTFWSFSLPGSGTFPEGVVKVQNECTLPD